jgi:hypothetical protein
MALNVATGFPPQSYPFIDDKLNILPAWYQGLIALQNRTGGGTGVDVTTVQEEAQAAQTTADAAQTGANASLKKAANLSDLTSVPAALGPLGLNLGPTAQSLTVTGWPASTSGARVSVNGAFTQTAGTLYSQTDTQALINQMKVLSQALAQLQNDLATFKAIGP